VRGRSSVVRLENFSAAEVLRAQQRGGELRPGGCVLTKYEPPRDLPARSGMDSLQMRYFDYHQDLSAAGDARLLMAIVWQIRRGENGLL